MMESEFFAAENHFHRLPPELIISIFDKISDAKWLCICCSVSKHFAALVLRTYFVSVQIPTAVLPFGEVPMLSAEPVWPPGVYSFLKKLHRVESVTIRFSFGKSNNIGWMRQHRSPPLLKWKSDSSSFIFVLVRNCVASSDNDSTSTEATSTRIVKQFIRQMLTHLQDATLRFSYIKELLAVLPNLKKVSLLDSLNQGSVVFEEEDIASAKKEPWEGLHECCVKWWKKSQVKLPFSRCVMKDVTLFSVQKNEVCDVFKAGNLFEEKEYRELAISLMKEEASSEPTFSLPIEANFADTVSMALLNFILQLENCKGGEVTPNEYKTLLNLWKKMMESEENHFHLQTLLNLWKKTMEPEKNHFHRLPTELIISIFDKILDVKWLCICCSVSKHFAALVLRTRYVSVPIPSHMISSDGVYPVWPPGILDFLKKLHRLESVTIRFSFGKLWKAPGQSKSLVRWKSDSSNFTLVFTKKCENDDDIRMLKDFFSMVVSHLHDNEFGFCYIKELLVVVPNVKNVSVVDSMNQGRIVLEEEGIASVKKEKPCLHNCHVKWWRRSEVKLPFSNCVIKDVILLSMRETDGFMETKNLFEEKEFCELATILMKEEATNSESSTTSHPTESCLHLISEFVLFLRRVGVCKGTHGRIC